MCRPELCSYSSLDTTCRRAGASTREYSISHCWLLRHSEITPFLPGTEIFAQLQNCQGGLYSLGSDVPRAYISRYIIQGRSRYRERSVEASRETPAMARRTRRPQPAFMAR